jgi:hypothetical protein
VPNKPKPGYLTTEFWLSLAATAVMVTVATGAITPGGAVEIQKDVQTVAAGLAGVIPATYALGRAIVKAFHR